MRTPAASATRMTIVDGSGYIFRAFFALKQQRQGGRNVELTTSQGMPTGALHVFASMLLRLYLDERPELCAVVFDSDGKTFRHEIDAEYKANRREPPPDLIPQFPWFEKIVAAMNLPVVRVDGVEADDVIATMVAQARARGLDAVIYSGDKDLMQLVDEHVVVVDSMRDVVYDVARVTEKFGVPPERVGDWLALRGDSSDNVPGMDGIGDVTATKLLCEHGSIDGILANANKLTGKLGEKFRDPEQLRKLEISRQLVRLRRDVPLPGDVLSMRRRDWDARALAEIFRALEFYRFLARLSATFVCDRDRYLTILDEEALDRVLDKCRENREMAVDTETTHLDPVRAELVGVSVATPGHPAVYVPVGHRFLGAPKQLDASLVLGKLKPLLEDPSVAKYDQNQKYEWVIFARHGIRMAGVRCDPMIASYLLDPSQPSHGLDALAKTHLGHDTIKYEEACGKGKDQKTFDQVDLAMATRYAAEDADVTLALGKLLRPRVEAAGLASLMDDVEIPLGRVLATMEMSGIRLDVGKLRELGQKVGASCADLERQIQELAGIPVNVSSPKQLGELIYNRLGLRTERMRKTKTGYSTDHEQLEELLGMHPIIKPILEHRELTKLKGTYLDALPPLVNPETGRLHTSYSQVAASTGRLASMSPNIQNIPVRTPLGREIRGAFVAEPGHVLMSADYSQIELRLIAHLSRDPVLLDAFERGLDVHSQTAAEVFGISMGEVTAEHRRVAKAVNYGLGYGQTDFGLSRSLDIPREEARRYIERYFTRFAGVRAFMETVVAQAREHQHVRTILGRRLPIPGITSSRYPERSAAERLARNAPIQGGAADILKLAMNRVHQVLESGKLCARMLLSVHDELVFEVREDDAQALREAVKREMEAAFPLEVPLVVDIGIGRSWEDAH
ncbi:MAG: DNA polymerase I [Deltaproteobacteria bacterium]|nr:DNA polymerase I [Deltaproteobacteria bacterium]